MPAQPPKLRVVFAGTPAAAVPPLDALLGSTHDVVAVLTRPDAEVGRGRHLAPSPVAERAGAAGVEVLKPRRPGEPDFRQRLSELAPDLVAVVAYGALVPASALQIPRLGWVNLHFSLLPAWRGAAPVQHAILHGDDITGATTFLLEEGLDTGPVLGVLTEAVRPRDTAGDLLERLSTAGAGLLLATVDGLAAATMRAVPQPADGVSLAPKLTPADARIDWTAPAQRIDRLVRACTPAPGAWAAFRGHRLGLRPVLPAPDEPSLAPGELAVAKTRVLVGTGTAPVVLGAVQPAGKQAMAAADWARGARPAAGEQLS